MATKFCSLASGSSGNSYYIKTENTAVLVDAGISGKKIIDGIRGIGEAPENTEALFITHEHIDHVKSIRVLSKKLPKLSLYTNQDTWEGISEGIDGSKHVPFQTGDTFTVGDIKVKTFSLSHDAVAPTGYSFAADGKRISIVTDTGCMTDEILNSVWDSDLLIMESNHDVETLMYGGYPYHVKRRIAGDQGHLSNEAAGEALCSIIAERERCGIKERPLVLLAHLSRENNFPEMALQTVRNRLEQSSYYIGKQLDVEIILRDTVSKVYTL